MKLTKLKRVAVLRAGGTPAVQAERFWREPPNGVPWVAIGDMSDGRVVSHTVRHVSAEGIAEKRLPVGHPGTVLFAMYASLGAVAELAVEASWNQALLGIEPMPGVSERRFVRYWLEHLRPSLGALARSNTQDNLNAEQVGNLDFPVLSPEAQRAIADYLDTETNRIDTLITKKRRMIELLEEREQSLIDQWSDELAVEHGRVPLRRWSERIEQGWSPVCDSEPAEGAEWGVIKTSAVSSGTFLPENNKRLPDEIEPDLRWMLRDGDLLVTRGSGSRRKVGRAAVARLTERNLTLSDLVYRIVLTEADPAYIALAMSASSVRKQLEGSIRTDAGQTLKVRRDDVAGVRIPAVVGEQQPHEVAGVSISLSMLRHSRRVIAAQRRLLTERRQALITAGVAGHLPTARVAR